MSDTTDNRPEGNDHSRPADSATERETTSPAAHDATPAAPRSDVPPMPTRSPAAAAAAWPPPAAGTAAPQARPAAGYASAPSGASTPTGQSFGPGATSAHPTLVMPGSASTPPRKKSSAPRIAALLVAAALVGGGAGLGGTYAGLSLWGGENASSVSGPTAITVNDPQDVNATAAVASKVVPSVVTISATGSQAGGTGSGVVLSADGYVLTNTHVVTLDGQTGNATISVTTSDGKVYAATVVGTDPTYDLAVIKLQNASGLTPIEFGDSSNLNVGDATVAIGAPLDLPNTVTTGIVSALNRSIQVASSAAPSDGSDQQQTEPGQESPFRFDFGQGQQSQSTNQTIKIAVIQTDAAINPGNSGGALVDDEGKLIGINVAIASAGGSSSGGQSGNIGVGFSIPSDIAKRISTEIIENGSATHGLLGASVQDAAAQQGATTTGALVAEATSGGAAQAAGLQKGDVITAFNGVPVTNSIDLTAQVRALAAGAQAEVTYLRGGQQKTAEVTLGSMPTS